MYCFVLLGIPALLELGTLAFHGTCDNVCKMCTQPITFDLFDSVSSLNKDCVALSYSIITFHILGSVAFQNINEIMRDSLLPHALTV